MRVSVRAGEVREGDRLIVPDGEHVVPEDYPMPDFKYLWLTPTIVRLRDELVVVERPDPPITISFTVARSDADALVNAPVTGFIDPRTPAQRVLSSVRAAIVAARAGDQQTERSTR